jgi:hypothetical protein
MNPAETRPAPAVVFQARGLTKVYRMGEVEVHALRGIDLETSTGRAGGAARAVGQRQVHPAQHPRRARYADGGEVATCDRDLTPPSDAS